LEEGMTLYTVANLERLWVQVQVLEADLAAIKAGMPVEITSVAWPGEIFRGNVDLLYPTLNAENRSVKARLSVLNKENKLRPGMYVNAVLRAPLGRYGPIGSASEPKPDPSELRPKNTQRTENVYTCPMHPEVLSDKLGDCPKCGMPLVIKSKADTSEDVYTCPMDPEVTSAVPGACPKCGMQLVKKPKTDASQQALTERWIEGYTCPMHPDMLQPKGGVCTICGCGMQTVKWRLERVLSIPETAVIDTGTRYVVYVQTMPGVYDARAVTLGPRTGIFYPVLGGLKLGEKIVSRGSFLIDAEARLNPAAVVGGEN
jgi:Cu(I)/Ag(I) efflux system membrane fusion protein